MLGTLMKYDWRNLSADRAPLAVAVVLGAAIAYGAFNGSEWIRFQKRAISEALAEEGERFDRIRGEIPKIDSSEKIVTAFADPWQPQSFGRNMGTRYAVMPPAPLGALAIGQSDLYPYYFRVSTNSKETFLNNDEVENPVHLLAGRFDLASQPVSLRRVVMAKVLLRAAFVAALAVLLSVVGVIIGGADLSAEGTWPRLFVWAAVTAVYGAFWFALAIAVNAMGRGSATNAMMLAGAWLLFVIVIPSVLNVAIKAAYPVPSRVELIQAIRVAGDESTRQGSKLLARYLEDHPELAPPSNGPGGPPDFGTLLVAVNEATERKVQPVLAEFDAQLASRIERSPLQTLPRSSGRISSPVASLLRASNSEEGEARRRRPRQVARLRVSRRTNRRRERKSRRGVSGAPGSRSARRYSGDLCVEALSGCWLISALLSGRSRERRCLRSPRFSRWRPASEPTPRSSAS